MRPPLLGLLVVVLVAIAHAFAFVYAMAFLGAGVGAKAVGATGSLLAFLFAASIAAAAISSAPLAFLTCFLGGRRLNTATVLLFVGVWAIFQLHLHGAAVARPSTAISLPIELVTIAIVSGAAGWLGASMASRRSTTWWRSRPRATGG